ncbi:hypothetical protein [Acidaminococcus fermentans]|uniref:hypothetical protein n=1 Tax=Acidaminococcus fermentans TaxID=905 RepID=UPI0024313F64|nr:hypothetical protein [Acidaminococcus fermentans]
MKSDLLLFLVWILFLLGSQLLRKKKRPLKKPSQSVRKPDPGPFVCEEARAPAQKEPSLQPTVKPVRSDLVEEIRDLKPTVAPQVVESRERQARPSGHPVLSGDLRQGMLWSLVLGEPRSKKSWAREQREKRGF